MRGRLAVIVLAVAAVAVAFLLRPAEEEPQNKGQAARGTPAPSNAVKVSFVYSPEKEPLLAPLIKQFNASSQKVDGRPVFVDARPGNSGDVETDVARGKLKPVVWSPASSLWGRLLNFEADQPLAPRSNESIVRSPLVIAMWEPMARALGWPRKPIGFADLVRLARSGAGWGDFGHPEWGPFKLVHTNPDFSTSGLEAVVAEYYAATGRTKGLTERDVTAPGARRTVRDLERSIVHYGDNTLFVADQMRARGPGYASAVAMEEVTLLAFNAKRGSQPRLVAIYPEEGTFYSDNPFIVLDADWVTPQQQRAAELLQRFLSEQITPAVAAASGFRPAGDAQPVAPVVAANGVDPSQPSKLLGLPEPRVLARIKENWRADRKPANVLLVVDTSGSMEEDGRLASAKQGVKTFLDQVGPNDRIGLTAFSDEIQPLLSVAPFPANRKPLEDAVANLIASGGTAVYDATSSAFAAVRQLGGGGDRINAVVLLTDGADTDSKQELDQVLAQLDQGDSENRVRVFTIAYSVESEQAENALKHIAAASGGKYYPGDTADIDSVYRSISSFF